MGSPRSSSATASAIAALAFLAACQPSEQTDNQALPANEPAPAPPAVPRVETLDRAAILAAVAQSASAVAAGADDSEAQRKLDGRQFQFRIRFGCRGPSESLRKEWLGWSFDAEEKTLRVRAQPTLGATDPLVQQIAGERFEAVEGFWIPRPWLLQAVCPAAAPAESPADAVQPVDSKPAESEQEPGGEQLPKWPRIGIAHFFSDTDARTGRREMRPYEAVKTIEAGGKVGSRGFDLVLSGRLRALPDKKVITCVAKGAQSPPECVISADFDRVWMETPGTSEVIAEWTSG